MSVPPIGMTSAVCGGGLCGSDIPGLSAAIAPMSNAAWYDGASRTILLNPDGTAQELHPVDQEVVFDLSNKLGSIASDPTRGLDTDAIRHAQDSAKLSTAQDRVNLCLAASLARGDIEIVGVQVEDPPVAGRLGISVTYKNLRLAASSKSAAQPAPTVHI